ncbi:MAG TPA: siphovirus Gp157 family protein [Phycisphaerae bacterium]|nr:siphovirus Gp157 family protein [Phycisphaerae bacterium]HQL76139.1 siphovirus Gp157 family protein [Phycisphaerae bacterium]
MKRTLLDITEDLQALDDLLTEAAGDITGVEATVDAWLAELEQDLKGKVDNYAALITAMNARAEVRKAEADRLYHRAKVDAGNAKFLRDRLKAALEMRGITKLETDRYKVGVAKVGGNLPLIIPDPAVVAHEFIRVKEIREPDKDAIRKALESGQQVTGAELGVRGTCLTIR